MSVRFSQLSKRVVMDRVGMSRHSALSAARAVSTAWPLSFALQVGALAIGSGLIGVAVALLVEARLGLAPYDVLASGLSQHIGLSLGQTSWVVAAVLFAVAALLGRPPSLWGIAFIVLNGASIDAASGLLQDPASMTMRILFVPAGIVVMAMGINVVIHSGTTGGPFELLMEAGEDRGVSRLKVRYFLDIGLLALGITLGGSFGPATVAFGAFMGLTLVAMTQAVEDFRCGRSIRIGLALEATERTTDPSADDRDIAGSSGRK